MPFYFDKESQLFRNKNNEYIRMLRIKGINLFGMKEDDQELRMRCFQNLLNPLIGDGQIFSYEIPADVDGYIDDYENMKATLDLQNDYDSSRYEILEENQTRLSETAITRELVDRIFLIILKDKDLARLEQRVNSARDIMQSFNSVYILDTQDMIEVIYNYYNPRNSTYLGEMEEDDGDIMDYIYPDSISYADNKLQQYINVNDVYCTTLYVSKYTKQNLGFLHILSTYPDVDFSMHFEPAPKNQVKSILDKSLKNTGKNLDNSKPGSEQADLQKQYENLEEIINQINVGDDLPYYFSVSIRLKADSLEGLIDYIKEVKDRTGLEVWKAFGIKDGFNIERINRCAADRVLADAYTESYGGAGRIFNWDIIKTAENARNKIILAGGLDSMNIESAARNAAPYALDLSSGVETGGFKDEKKIKEIVRIVRNLESKAGERYGIPKTRK